MEIYLIFVWYISCLHLCRLPRLRMEICRWWGKLFHCLSSSVWSVLSKWPPDCPSSVPRSPAATRSSPPLIGRDLVDHSGEEEGGWWWWWWWGGDLHLPAITTLHWGPDSAALHPSAHQCKYQTLSSLSSKEEMWFSIHQFMFRCKTVTNNTIFHVCSFGLFFGKNIHFLSITTAVRITPLK